MAEDSETMWAPWVQLPSKPVVHQQGGTGSPTVARHSAVHDHPDNGIDATGVRELTGEAVLEPEEIKLSGNPLPGSCAMDCGDRESS